MRGWAYPLAVAALFSAADYAFGLAANRTFLPSRKLAKALELGDGCVAVTGDSRMAAGLNPAQFERSLGGEVTTSCVADLTQGGVGITGQAIAVRTYLGEGARPSIAVLGTVPESLLEGPFPNPSNWIGSEALILLWARTGDSRLLFGGLPSNIGQLDARIRYLLYRRSSLATFRSILWLHAQHLQDRLLGKATNTNNRFGDVAEMRALGAAFRASAEEALKRHREEEPWKFSPWLLELERGLALQGVHLVVAELPMPAAYGPVRESLAGRSLRRSLREQLELTGGHWVDLASPSWLSEDLFEDGIHLGPRGATLLSAALADEVGAVAGRSK